MTKAFYLCLSMYIFFVCFILFVCFKYLKPCLFNWKLYIFPVCEDSVHFSFVCLYDLNYKDLVWSTLSWAHGRSNYKSVLQVCHWKNGWLFHCGCVPGLPLIHTNIIHNAVLCQSILEWGIVESWIQASRGSVLVIPTGPCMLSLMVCWHFNFCWHSQWIYFSQLIL